MIVTIRHGAKTLSAAHDPDGDGIAKTNGFPLPDPETVFSGPFVRLKNSVLSIDDGTEGYQIDFSGKLPIYKALCK